MSPSKVKLKDCLMPLCWTILVIRSTKSLRLMVNIFHYLLYNDLFKSTYVMYLCSFYVYYTCNLKSKFKSEIIAHGVIVLVLCNRSKRYVKRKICFCMKIYVSSNCTAIKKRIPAFNYILDFYTIRLLFVWMASSLIRFSFNLNYLGN